MLMDKILLYGTDILLIVFAVYLFFYYFDIFFKRKKKKLLFVIGIGVFVIWQFGIAGISVLPISINIAVTIMVTLFAVINIYEGSVQNKCVFVIAFNAIWMLMETICNYLLMTFCEQYAMIQALGSVISKVFFLIVIMALKRVFMSDEIRELSAKYSIMLVLIPTGSIYIMNSIFMLDYQVNNHRVMANSVIAAVILLGINVLIFYMYMKLADDLQLKRKNAVYEQQLELCERHQQERELSILQLRDAKHNMKNNLISILAYAENGENDKIIKFVNEVMEGGGMAAPAITNSGNIVIDSLIGYWYVMAQREGIDFSVNLAIPMMIPFKGADISLILGNLLENAVEAAKSAAGDKYITVHIKYDRNNLLIFMTNSYKGTLLKSKDNKLKTTKSDAGNHGVGLSSVYHAALKYQGTVVIDDSVPECFKIRVVLYGTQE